MPGAPTRRSRPSTAPTHSPTHPSGRSTPGCSKCRASSGDDPMTAASLVSIRDRVARGEGSASDVCRQALDRIDALNPQLGAFLTVTHETALARAAELDRDRTRWRDAPLLGVPVALKDN